MSSEDKAPGQASEETPLSAAEESKRKFREALDRKKQQQAQPRGKSKRDEGGQQGQTHGPASHQREFRRKSG